MDGDRVDVVHLREDSVRADGLAGKVETTCGQVDQHGEWFVERCGWIHRLANFCGVPSGLVHLRHEYASATSASHSWNVHSILTVFGQYFDSVLTVF